MEKVNDKAEKDQKSRENFVENMFTRPQFKEKTERLLGKFSRFMEQNPRSMTRMVSAFGLWHVRDILSEYNTDEDKLAQWVIINQRWPMMASFLEERPEIVDKIIGKDTRCWDKILEDEKVGELEKKMFLDPAIADVLTGKGVTGKPIDSDTIRNLASR